MSAPAAIPPEIVQAIIEAVEKAQRPTSKWRGIKGQAERVDVSERLMRDWISRPTNPAPAVKVGGKVLLNDADLDRWSRGHKVGRDLDELARNVLAGLGGHQ